MRSLVLLLLVGLLSSYSTVAAEPFVVQLIDGSNSNVGNGWVEVWQATTDQYPIISGPTDAHGRFSYAHCPRLVSAIIRAVACPFKVTELVVKLPQGPITMKLEQEQPLSEICNTLGFKETAAICVRVRSMECLPLRRTQLVLSSKSTAYLEKKSVDSNGVAAFTNISPGNDYILQADGEPGYCKVVKKYPILKPGVSEMADLKACTYEAKK